MDERKYVVYRHSFPNNKVYIGITKQRVDKRWQNGAGYMHNKRMQNAIKKYGWDNIRHEILSQNLTKEEAEYLEIKLISEYQSNSSEFGYNIASGGFAPELSDETKRKISESKIGDKNPMYGKHLIKSESTRKKLSEANKGRKISDAQKERIRESNRCRVVSEETRAKISNGNHKAFARKSDEEKQRQIRGILSSAHNKSISVLQYSSDGLKLLNTYISINEAARENSLFPANIRKCLMGNIRQTCGYIWKYAS